MTTFDELLAENGFDPQRASGGRELIIECPFCGRKKLYVNATTGLWLCYRCEERGNKWSLLEKVLGIDPIRTGYIIRTKLDSVEDGRGPQLGPGPLTKPPWLPTGFVTLPPFSSGALSQTLYDSYSYHRYLIRRRFSALHIQMFRIGYAPGNPAYDWRVIIPVFMHGQLRSFVARSIYDECFRCHAGAVGFPPICECPVGWLRVLYPPGSKMSELLFNLDSVDRGSDAILVEGVFDAMRVSPTLGNVVATFGSHLSQTQRSLLRRAGVETVIIMFDGDEAGRAGTAKAAEELRSDLFRVRIVDLPDGTDPASLTEDQVRQHLQEVREYSSFPLTNRT
jgi:hypothetical protein